MEPIHILILGGDVNFLPFAKRKVRELAERVGPTGYGSAKYVVASTTIWVDARAGMQRITMDGSGGLFMDSGAVDIQTVTLADPTIADTDGILYYNTAAQAQAVEKKLLGKITVPSLACNPPVSGEASLSFKAKVKDGVRVEASTDKLVSKKTCSKLAPPSQFTGKMRLFVQAKYGAPLADWNITINTDNEPPALGITSKGQSYTIDPGRCGIFTDDLMRHWLVQIGMDGIEAYAGITIFRLDATSDAAPLRALLLDTTRDAEQRDRIEAYILSTALPNYATKVQLPGAMPTIESAMGYGWHFSWSGASVDVVSHTSSAFGSGLQYLATHYRIAIAKSSADVWSATSSVVESATWGNSKWKTVIAYPLWSDDKLAIFGSTLGLKQATDAPVYCFWRREAWEEKFEMIRFSYEAGSAGTRSEWVSDPPYYWGMLPEHPGASTAPPCATQGVSIGLEATRYDSITYPASATTTSFRSSTETISVSQRNSTSVGREGTEKSSFNAGNIASGPAAGYPVQSIYDGVPGTMPYVPTQPANFCAIGPAAGLGAFTGLTPHGGTWTAFNSRVTWTQYEFSDVNTEDFASLMVIPFGDAEAVYLYGKKYRQVVNTKSTKRAMDSTVFDSDYVSYFQIVSGASTFTWLNYGSGIDTDHDVAAPVADGTVTTTSPDDVWTLVGSKLISNAGVMDTTWQPSNAFFAGDPTETVDQQLFTLTSIAGDVKGEEIDLTGGYELNDEPFVFVGWA